MSVVMIKRDDVVALLDSYVAGPRGAEWEECCRDIIGNVCKLPCWPAPDLVTEDEFWSMVDGK